MNKEERQRLNNQFNNWNEKARELYQRLEDIATHFDLLLEEEEFKELCNRLKELTDHNMTDAISTVNTTLQYLANQPIGKSGIREQKLDKLIHDLQDRQGHSLDLVSIVNKLIKLGYKNQENATKSYIFIPDDKGSFEIQIMVRDTNVKAKFSLVDKRYIEVDAENCKTKQRIENMQVFDEQSFDDFSNTWLKKDNS